MELGASTCYAGLSLRLAPNAIGEVIVLLLVSVASLYSAFVLILVMMAGTVGGMVGTMVTV
jgi:hypothetical protein